MRHLSLFFTILIFFISTEVCFSEIIYESAYMPKAIKKYTELTAEKSLYPIKVRYIMKWHEYKVYRIAYIEKGVIWGGTPKYILYKGRKARIPTKEENHTLQLDAVNYCNHKRYQKYLELEKKLKKNAKQVIRISENTPPPKVPDAVTKYADKYMPNPKNRIIFYLMDWNGQHVYRTYWPKYGLLPIPASIILYDNETIRRPTEDEFKTMQSSMGNALLKHAMEQARSNSKD